MSAGIILISLGILLCAAALVTTILLALTARRSKQRILDKMEQKY